MDRSRPSTTPVQSPLTAFSMKFHQHLSTIPVEFRPSTIAAYENISTSTFVVDMKQSTLYSHFSSIRMSHSTILIEKNIEERKIFFSKTSDDDYYERLSTLTAEHMVKFHDLVKERQQREAELLVLDKVKEYLENQIKTL